jgi:hypothetical protein
MKTMKNKYPIYIVSKGRSWLSMGTWKQLDEMKVTYYVIVDPIEYDTYNNVINKEYGTVLAMPDKYKEEYDMFWVDDVKTTGPGASRNYAWEHAKQAGHKRHWVMDDNLEAFYRLHENKRLKVKSSSCLRAMEDFTDRHTNVALSGPNYMMFADPNPKRQPYTTNTRVYSCILINNDIPYRWRGRYNEDTDLSLRALKDGWCTIQFLQFLQAKRNTSQKKGGNTEQFYDKEGTLNKSQMLVDMHPDVTKLVWKFNRWHHLVDYTQYTQELKPIDNLVIPKGINTYGMKLITVKK